MSDRLHVRKRKRSLFPGIHQSNKSSLHLDVTEAPRSETESPFLYCSNILSCGYEAGKWTSSWIQWGTASEGSPALWWWSWKLHHTLVWPISPDNSLWGTYRRMGQDPKKRVRNLSVGGQREGLRPWHRSWGRRLGIRKGVIKPQETPCSWASTPKTRVCFMLSPTPLTLQGLSPITISLGEGVNLQLQVNKNSWAWQECFSLWTPLKVI